MMKTNDGAEAPTTVWYKRIGIENVGISGSVDRSITVVTASSAEKAAATAAAEQEKKRKHEERQAASANVHPSYSGRPY